MKTNLAVVTYLLITSLALFGQEKPRLAIVGDLGIEYITFGGSGFSKVAQAGLGSIQDQGLAGNFDIGVGVSVPTLILGTLEVNYTVGGVSWENALGVSGAVPVYFNALDVRTELELIPPILNGFYPFIGLGYTIMNDFSDTNNDGFRNGGGSLDFLGGIDIANLGLINFYDPHGFLAVRLGVIYRLPYSYRNFYIGGSQVPEGAYGGVFDSPINAQTVEYYLGMRICYIP